MESVITKEVLQPTGFSTWYEFNYRIYSSRQLPNNKVQYTYHDKKNQEAEIELEVSPTIIDFLAREEIQIVLEKFNILNIKEFNDMIKSNGLDRKEKVTLEKITRTEKDQVVLQRYILSVKAVQRLATNEGSYM